MSTGLREKITIAVLPLFLHRNAIVKGQEHTSPYLTPTPDRFFGINYDGMKRRDEIFGKTNSNEDMERRNRYTLEFKEKVVTKILLKTEMENQITGKHKLDPQTVSQ